MLEAAQGDANNKDGVHTVSKNYTGKPRYTLGVCVTEQGHRKDDTGNTNQGGNSCPLIGEDFEWEDTYQGHQDSKAVRQKFSRTPGLGLAPQSKGTDDRMTQIEDTQ